MNDATLRTLIDETVARALTKIRVPMLRPGTVTEASTPLVLVDGDTIAVEVASICGAVSVGQRVMVMYHPPAGAVIIGRIDSPALTDVFESSGTWTKLSGTRMVEVILIGGGGGGGTGRSDVTGTLRNGGGGGGGGGYTRLVLSESAFNESETVTVGVGGVGGVNPGTVVANGTAGSIGGNSIMTTAMVTPNTSELITLLGGGGTGGLGGTATGGGTGGGGGRGLLQGMRGGAASDTGGVGTASHTWRTDEATPTYTQNLANTVDLVRGPPGGASGGGITAANVGADGGAGTVWGPLGSVLSAAAGTTGVTGDPGDDGYSAPVGMWIAGGSGGGGAASGGPPPVSGGRGGNGGNYGAGGGGGSGKSSGSTVGDGGDGGAGIVVVIAHL